jgi:hypothetical protein
MYSTWRKIPSCHVDLDLLREVEDYVLTTAQHLNPETSKQKAFILWVFEEGGGETNLRSMDEFRGRHFYDRTTNVTLHFDTMKEPGYEIRIALGPSSASLRVATKGLADERGTAIGIGESIVEKFRHYSNWNSVYHWHELAGLLLMISAVLWFLVTVPVVPLQWAPLIKGHLVTSIALAIAWIYLFSGSRCLPYCQLKSPRNDLRARRFWKFHWAFIPGMLLALSSLVYKIVLK